MASRRDQLIRRLRKAKTRTDLKSRASKGQNNSQRGTPVLGRRGYLRGAQLLANNDLQGPLLRREPVARYVDSIVYSSAVLYILSYFF